MDIVINIGNTGLIVLGLFFVLISVWLAVKPSKRR